MRTTLTLDDDIVARLVELQKQQNAAFKDVVNDTLRRGLEAQSAQLKAIKPFKVKAHDMGIRPGLNYANIGELLAHLEGETHK